jgi:hypothetical protein
LQPQIRQASTEDGIARCSNFGLGLGPALGGVTAAFAGVPLLLDLRLLKLRTLALDYHVGNSLKSVLRLGQRREPERAPFPREPEPKPGRDLFVQHLREASPAAVRPQTDSGDHV